MNSNDRVMIMGAGFIGVLFAKLLRYYGVSDILLVDPNAVRRRLTEEIGFRSVRFESLLDELDRSDFRPTLAIDCSGIPTAVEKAVECVSLGGRVLLFGVATPQVTMKLKPYEIFRKELSILGSFVNPFTTGRAVHLLSKMDLEPLISHVYPLEEFSRAWETKFEDAASWKVLLRPSDSRKEN